MFSQPLLCHHIPLSAVCTSCVGRSELFRFVSRFTHFLEPCLLEVLSFCAGFLWRMGGVVWLEGLGNFLGGRWRRLFFICDFMVVMEEWWGCI